MEIKNLKISNYKSIEHIDLNNVNAFSVFVGANASGKSNIFEAIEFIDICNKIGNIMDALRLFGKAEDIFNKNLISNLEINLECTLNNEICPSINITAKNGATGILIEGGSQDYASVLLHDKNGELSDLTSELKLDEIDFKSLKQFYNFTRLFVGNSKIKRNNYIDDLKLNADASNLELVLKRVLKNENLRNEFLEELNLLIPGFENIEIRSDEISGTDTLLIYEKGSKKPFGKNLLSDGTYNIVALLTAVYQSEEPQFLCIEEPENGLNPFVAKEFVRIFRDACNDKGHFIWINTHSQSILSELKQQELIIVDKINGGTIAKQINDIDLQGMKMDEALFTNILGGGTPW
jgi:predicted ATPase